MYNRILKWVPTESYDEYTQIIDIKDLSIQNWNAIRFLSKETDQGFQDYMNFKSIKQETNIYATENKNYEYYKYPNIIGYPDCNLACPIMNADMPKKSLANIQIVQDNFFSSLS